ncbi:hypothetical protein RO575_02435 [Methylomonas sp. MO1]|uniref:hypothetical protein n=1 Tax=unclassified Methylomonas TaxID=2608980 RepID=UPI00047EA30D|nr:MULTISPECIES: hypothetical protein [unclassified Methylomonas]MDT4288406.1 hypothetical protein [Methylomonas sp. MO1]
MTKNIRVRLISLQFIGYLRTLAVEFGDGIGTNKKLNNASFNNQNELKALRPEVKGEAHALDSEIIKPVF